MPAVGARRPPKLTQAKFRALISTWDKMQEEMFAQQQADKLLEDIIVAFATVPEADQWYQGWKRDHFGRAPRSI